MRNLLLLPCVKLKLFQEPLATILLHTRLLTQFPEITRPTGESSVQEVKHNTLHYIKTMPGPPVFSCPRRLASDRLRIREFEDIVRAGIARTSDSYWSSPLHLIPKKDSSW